MPIRLLPKMLLWFICPTLPGVPTSPCTTPYRSVPPPVRQASSFGNMRWKSGRDLGEDCPAPALFASGDHIEFCSSIPYFPIFTHSNSLRSYATIKMGFGQQPDRHALWYVFPKINNVARNINSMVNRGDYFLVSQNFPPLSSNFVGKDIIPDPQVILDLFSGYFKPLKTVWLEDKISDGNDNWFIAIMQRR